MPDETELYAYPNLAQSSVAGRYLAAVVRKKEAPDRALVIQSAYTVVGGLLNLSVGPAEVSTQSVIPLESEEQVLSVLEHLEEADDSDPGSVRALGLIGDAGRKIVLNLVLKMLQDVLAGMDWEAIIRKFLDGTLPTPKPS